MIVKGKFVKGNQQKVSSQLNKHLKYIQYRKRDEKGEKLESRNPPDQEIASQIKYMQYRKGEDRYLFGKEHDQIDRKKIHEDIMKHASPAVSYHKLILSPADDEPVHDWKSWTRQVMTDLEEYQATQLHWYAVVHTNTAHTHVHVILAGLGQNTQGNPTKVALYVKERAQDGIGAYEILKRSGREHSDYENFHHLQETLQEIETFYDDTTELIGNQGKREELDLFS